MLWQTTITWQRLIKKALDPYQISHAQFVILAILYWLLASKQPSTQALLVRQSKLDKMTISKSLKKLAAMGLIKRREDEGDTRAKSVSLTSKAKTLLAKLVPLVEEIDAEFFGTINGREQKLLMRLLNRLKN